MRVERGVVSVRTRRKTDVLDITELIRTALREMNTSEGILHIYVPHTTVGIVINEAESGLLHDIESLLEKLVPELEAYEHNRVDSNAHAHLRNVLTSSFVTVPISSGDLVLGTWQRILLVEGDGPRERTLLLTYVGL